MKFDSDKDTGYARGLHLLMGTGSLIESGDIDALEAVLRNYSSVCGEKTRRRLMDAIGQGPLPISKEEEDRRDGGTDYSDTPIFGRCYVYLWFDFEGNLFYIGKGKYDRAIDFSRRSKEFKERANGGFCRYVAYNLNERYALDLERILIWEAALAGKKILNIDGGVGIAACQYCKHDRDGLLWYWNNEGTIDRFSELSGIEVVYDARNTDMNQALDSRLRWGDRDRPRTNDNSILMDMKKQEVRREEKKRKAREYQAARRLRARAANGDGVKDRELVYKEIVEKRRAKNNYETPRVFWEIDGVTKPARDWCSEYGIGMCTVEKRMRNHGLSLKQALVFPRVPSGRRRDPIIYWKELGLI